MLLHQSTENFAQQKTYLVVEKLIYTVQHVIGNNQILPVEVLIVERKEENILRQIFSRHVNRMLKF